MDVPLNSALFPDFTNFTKAGEGAFGSVYTAIHKATNFPVAIKKVDKICLMTEALRNSFLQEISILEKVDHPFCIHFFERREDGNSIYLVMESAPGGTLLQQLLSTGRMKEPDAQRVFCQLLSAIAYLHEKCNVVHRDIKPENILFDEHHNIRLVDFGLSVFASPNQILTERCGSISYTAPEMLKNKPYTSSVDIWSLGVTLFVLMAGKLPFSSTDLVHGINTDPPMPPGISSDLSQLLTAILAQDPANRPSPAKIATFPWVSSSRWAYYLTGDFQDGVRYSVQPHALQELDYAILKLFPFQSEAEKDTAISDILSNKPNENTMIYKIGRKKKIMELLGSPEEIRQMFSRRHTTPTILGKTGNLSIVPNPRKYSNCHTFVSQTPQANRIHNPAFPKPQSHNTDSFLENLVPSARGGHGKEKILRKTKGKVSVKSVDLSSISFPDDL